MQRLRIFTGLLTYEANVLCAIRIQKMSNEYTWFGFSALCACFAADFCGHLC